MSAYSQAIINLQGGKSCKKDNTQNVLNHNQSLNNRFENKEKEDSKKEGRLMKCLWATCAVTISTSRDMPQPQYYFHLEIILLFK